jgi:hypothetical protein
MIIFTVLLITGILTELTLKPRLDWDDINKQLFLWYNWGGRQYTKLYEQNRFN